MSVLEHPRAKLEDNFQSQSSSKSQTKGNSWKNTQYSPAKQSKNAMMLRISSREKSWKQTQKQASKRHMKIAMVRETGLLNKEVV